MAEYKKMTDCDIIDPKAPWKNDKLKRQKVADDFTAILNGINNQPFVISIDSAYGTGKTFFIKRWVEDLKNAGITTCYYNAWNTDYQIDPLVPFVNSIIKQFPKDISDKLQENFENLIGVLKTASNFAIKCFNGQDKTIDEVAALAQQAFEYFQETGRDFIKNNDQTIGIIEAFKAKLADEAQKRKIVICVDELERCRPTYAVGLLEIIKHLFSVPNVIFVLSTDRQQLKHTIAKLYGANMDGEGYLRRFVDLELHLPLPDRSVFCSYLQSAYAIQNEKLGAEHVEGWNYFKNNFTLWADIYKLSLREMEQIWIEVSYLANVIPENNLKLMPVLAWLLIVKSKDTDLFYKFRNCDLQSIKKYLQTKVPTDIQSNNMCYEDFIIYLEICTTLPENLNKLSSAPDSENNVLANRWTGIKFTYHLFDDKPLCEYMCNILSYVSPIPIAEP